MKIDTISYSIHELGQRKNQEDSLFPAGADGTEGGSLFILCDGMGGHERGEVASATVCEVMSRYLEEHGPSDGSFGKADFEAALSAAYDALDELDDDSEKKMGTTLTFLKLHSGGAFIAHIGDSRIYHVRPGEKRILHVTSDHSLVNDLVKLGELTPEDARTSNQKNIITRAVQPHQPRRSRADCLGIEDVKEGDIFFLCSDGILEEMTDEQLCNVLCMEGKTDAERMEIIREATKDNRDNHTAHLVRITAVTEDAPSSLTENDVTQDSADTVEDTVEELAGRRGWVRCAVAIAAVLMAVCIAAYFLFGKSTSGKV